MHKFLGILILALASIFGVIAGTTFIADANNNGYQIDDDPTLPECDYTNPISKQDCNRPVEFLNEIPAALAGEVFQDTIISAGGRVFAVECAHTTGQTLCVLGLEVVEPTPTPVPIDPKCDEGFESGGIINGLQVCNPINPAPAPVPSFTG